MKAPWPAAPLLALALGSAHAQTLPRFASQQYVTPHDTGVNPWGVAVADVDNDGRNDVVAPGVGGLFVYLAANGGALLGPEKIPLFSGFTRIALGDLDEDGQVDVVFRDGSALAWAAGDGQGGFGPATPFAALPSAPFLAVSDMDGDAHLDVIAGGAGVVQVFLGDGGGSFSPAPPAGVGSAVLASMVVGDLDLDGQGDVVVGAAPGIVALLGTGGGGLVLSDTQVLAGLLGSLALGDLDADGDLDLIAGESSSVSVLLGLGDGTFQGPSTFDQIAGTAVALADWDADGRLDLLAGDSGSGQGLRWLAGDGLGGFRRPQALPSGLFTVAVHPTDVDADGRLDLVCGVDGGFYLPVAGGSIEPFGKVGVLLGDGASGVRGWVQSPELPASTSPGNQRWSALAEVTGDGVPDLLGWRQQPPTLLIRLGNGLGGFGSVLEHPLPFVPFEVQAGDVDGDGEPDLVATHLTGSLPQAMTLLANGLGGFGAPQVSVLPDFPVARLADWNGDGRADLLQCSDDLFVSLGQPDGTFAAGPPLSGFGPGGTLEVGDLDSDGALDFVSGRSSTTFNSSAFDVVLGDGQGGVRSQSQLFLPRADSVVLGDLDADGFPEMCFGRAVSISGTHYDVGVLFNDGSGGLYPARLHPVGAQPQVVDVHDLDGDGVADLVAGLDSGAIVILPGSKSRRLLRQRHHGLRANEQLLGAADADGDGRLDLITTSGTRPATYLNQGP